MNGKFALALMLALGPTFPALADDPARTSLNVVGPADEEYFPLKVGTTWEYKFDNGQTQTRSIVKKELFNGILCARLETTNGGVVTTHSHLSAMRDGMYQWSLGDNKINPPRRQLKFPARVGDAWRSDALNESYTIAGRENVAVPAGNYPNALLIVIEDGKKREYKLWYARGIGLVRLESDLGGRKLTLELTKFTPGK
jgi:hypothetical protein